MVLMKLFILVAFFTGFCTASELTASELHEFGSEDAFLIKSSTASTDEINSLSFALLQEVRGLFVKPRTDRDPEFRGSFVDSTRFHKNLKAFFEGESSNWHACQILPARYVKDVLKCDEYPDGKYVFFEIASIESFKEMVMRASTRFDYLTSLSYENPDKDLRKDSCQVDDEAPEGELLWHVYRMRVCVMNVGDAMGYFALLLNS